MGSPGYFCGLVDNEVGVTNLIFQSPRTVQTSYRGTKSLDVYTEDNLQYKFYPVTSQVFRFQVKARNDAHISLTPDPVARPEAIIEIIIGGYNNTRSMILKNHTENCSNETKDILNGDEYRGFCVRWTNDAVYVKCEGDINDFLAWQDPELFKVNYVGLRTCIGAQGVWAIKVPAHYGTWQEAERGQVPDDAVVGGQDCTGELIYVAKACCDDVTTPGKLVTSHGCAMIPWRGKEHRNPTYKVLVGGPHNWVATSGKNVPTSAFPAGKSNDGEPLFIGRVRHAGSVTTGRVQKSHGVCYISFGGKELKFDKYEVLTE